MKKGNGKAPIGSAGLAALLGFELLDLADVAAVRIIDGHRSDVIKGAAAVAEKIRAPEQS